MPFVTCAFHGSVTPWCKGYQGIGRDLGLLLPGTAEALGSLRSTVVVCFRCIVLLGYLPYLVYIRYGGCEHRKLATAVEPNQGGSRRSAGFTTNYV